MIKKKLTYALMLGGITTHVAVHCGAAKKAGEAGCYAPNCFSMPFFATTFLLLLCMVYTTHIKKG